MSRTRRLRRCESDRRRGTTAVETAIIITVLLTLVIGLMQFSWIFLVRHGIQHACREGARAYAVQGATSTEATDRTNQVLQDLFSAGFAAEFTVTSSANGNDRTITITVPTSSNIVSFGIGDIFSLLGNLPTLSASANFRDEATF